MYYYIFDTKKFKKKSQVETLKDYLNSLGINGEFTYISAAATAEELTEAGLCKGYTTIVAVGSDNLANAVANMIIGRSEALGIIPIEASENLHHLLGVDNWKEAAETLRFRRIFETNIGKTASGQHFLTNLTLDIQKPIEVTVEFKDYIVQANAKNLMISNFHPEIKKIAPDHLDIVLESEPEKTGGFLGSITKAFSKKTDFKNKNITILHARSLRLFTKKQIGLDSESTIITKTPQLIESTDETIRLIVSKRGPSAQLNI